MDILANEEWEIEYTLEFIKADLADGDVVEFQVYDSNNDGNQTYTVTAHSTITIPPPPATWRQNEYRWREDDGNETTATWPVLANNNLDIDVSSGNVQQRLRFVIYEFGDNPETYLDGQMEYQLNAGAWTDMTTVSSEVKAFDSTNITNGGDTTAQIIGTIISPNAGIIEDGIGGDADFLGLDFVEVEYTIEFIAADLADSDAMLFRVKGLDAYNSTGSATITKISGTLYYSTPVGSLTGTGAMTSVNLFARLMAGVITAAGIVATKLTAFRTVVGSLTSTGALSTVLTAFRTFTGSITPSGLLTKATTYVRAFAGSITGSGIVSGVKKVVKVLTGSITASGILLKRIPLHLVGVITSTGSITKKTFKSFTGSITGSGILTTAKLYFRTFTGSITATSVLVGNKVVGLFYQAVSGSMTVAGTVNKKTSILFSSTITSSGILAKKTLKTLEGFLTSAGTVFKRMSLLLIGSITASGLLDTLITVQRTVTGTITASGTIVKRTGKALAGGITATGLLLKKIPMRLAGSITATGALFKKTSKLFTSSITAIGNLFPSFVSFKTIAGSITMTSIVAGIVGITPIIVGHAKRLYYRMLGRR